MLLLEANRVVPVARLVEAAWDSCPPSSASHQIRKAVAELRQRIPGGSGFIQTAGPGYRAVVAEDQLDLSQYRARVSRARQAVSEGNRVRAVDELQAALELWRGPVMAGFGGPVIDAASAALEEQHLGAAEQLFQLKLAEGRAVDVVGELRTLVHRYPLRETLRAQLMLALYRTGRQAEALEEYNRVRALLADELGIDPCVELAALYERILRQSPDLAALTTPAESPHAPSVPQDACAIESVAPAAPAGSAGSAQAPPVPGAPPASAAPAAGPAWAASAAPSVPVAPVAPSADAASADGLPPPSERDREPPAPSTPAASPPTAATPAASPPSAGAVPSALPYDLRDFSGREAELRWISETVRRAPGVCGQCARIVAIDGMGGSGKTALAVRAAHRLAEDYPDGQLFVDLRGYTPGQEPLSTLMAQEALLAAAGVPSDEVPTAAAGRTALWGSITRQRKLLIVLDNAADADHVRPLIPSSPSCLTLITSRPRLVDLDGADWLSLGVLSEEDGLDLLRGTLGAERVAREPAAAAELIRLCGGLPLAVRIAAARLRNRSHWTIQRLAGRLADETRRLDELNSAGRSVAVALRMSYQAMNDRQRADLRLLGLHPGKTLSPEEAGALLDRTPLEAEDALEALLDAHLLDEHEPGLYSFHDLVRSFALGLRGSGTAQQEEQAVERLLDHYVLSAERACDALFPERSRHADLLPTRAAGPPPFPGRDAALAWLDRHRDSMLAAVELAHSHGRYRHAAYLPRTLSFHSAIRNYPQDARRACTIGVTAARALGDRDMLRLSLTTLAVEHWMVGAFPEGVTCLEEALVLARSLGDQESEAGCMGRLGQMYNSLGEFHQALGFLEGASLLEQQLGSAREQAGTLNVLSSVTVRLGKFEEAADTAARAIDLWEAIGDPGHTIVARSSLAFALIGLRRPQQALKELDAALRLCDDLNGPATTALILAQHSAAHVLLGEHDQAKEYVERALQIPAMRDVTVRQATVESIAGRVYRAVGEPELALARGRRAYELAVSIKFRYEMAQALDTLADASLALGETTKAEDYRQRADALYERMGVPENARRLF
ncbi:BTAD domain-containing putative transcriptional regulator [Streptomyces sp. TRM 70351]|uniref:AfsR/SARP family transcriptional regulator n=1 Tax=Streptomyces sp. TRM 70351 TaxID=3116552 RepID=UPI002E7B3A14|nr:BTAD domain-containing putative transcriptional regulator [Streptomyces sp. TRM 70351]MEE1929375.1 BTAD domain-containing putative transcriptional regulator [Streptomyces sp. TRM 70351]